MEGRTRGQGKPQAISLVAAKHAIQSEQKKGDGRTKGSADDKGGWERLKTTRTQLPVFYFIPFTDARHVATIVFFSEVSLSSPHVMFIRRLLPGVNLSKRGAARQGGCMRCRDG